MLFPEALTELDQYRTLKAALKIPILANITEFGKTPLFTREDLVSADIDMALYPLSAYRAMSQAAFQVLAEIRHKGNQRDLIEKMQTRDELYEILHYQEYEKKSDNYLAKL
jgi:methylisocitrate lyase